MKQSFKTKLKQLWVPKPFRLPEPEFSKEQVDLLEELIQLIQPTVSLASSMSRDDRAYMAQFLVDLGTGIWRIRRKIESLGRMPKEIREALYSLESTWMSMSEGGVEIVDHIGTLPSSDEAVIVEVRSIANLAREQVVDALKPTILLKGEVIQKGEVVIGRPIKDAPHEEPRQLQAGVQSAFILTNTGKPVPEPEEVPMTSKVETFAMEMPVEMSEMPVREEELGAAVNRILVESTTAVADEILDDPHENDPVLDAVIRSEPTGEAVPEQIEEIQENVADEVAEAEEVSAPIDDLSALDAELDEVASASGSVIEEAQELLDAAGDGSDGGFVRDVPTPLDMAIAAEEAEKPKKKKKTVKTTKTAAKKAKAEKIADAEDEKTKRRARPKKASEDTDNG